MTWKRERDYYVRQALDYNKHLKKPLQEVRIPRIASVVVSPKYDWNEPVQLPYVIVHFCLQGLDGQPLVSIHNWY